MPIESERGSSTTASVVDDVSIGIGKKRKTCGDPIKFHLSSDSKKNKGNKSSYDGGTGEMDSWTPEIDDKKKSECDEEPKDDDMDVIMKIVSPNRRKPSANKKLVCLFLLT